MMKNFVIFSGNFNCVELKDDIIFAEANIDILQLSEFTLENSLSGFEIFYDIPSSLGDAIVMNAGTGGEDIKSLLLYANYYNPHTNTVHTLKKKKEDLNIGKLSKKHGGFIINRNKATGNDILDIPNTRKDKKQLWFYPRG